MYVVRCMVGRSEIVGLEGGYKEGYFVPKFLSQLEKKSKDYGNIYASIKIKDRKNLLHGTVFPFLVKLIFCFSL